MFSNKFDENERETRLRNLLTHKTNEGIVRVTTPQELIRFMARSAEEEETFSSMDLETFGEDIYRKIFEHDPALDDSEGMDQTTKHEDEDDETETETAAKDTQTMEDSSDVGGDNTKRIKDISNRVEQLLISSGRLINHNEIPQDILLIQGIPKDEEIFAVSAVRVCVCVCVYFISGSWCSQI